MKSNVVFLDRDRIDLSFIEVRPGDWVVVKPNLVKESKETDPEEWRSVITAPSLIEAVCDHVAESLEGRGKITICDAPQTDSSFSRIAELADLHGIAQRCSAQHQIEVEVVDLRNEEWTNEGGIITHRKKLSGDPNGSIAFNLGRDSLFYGHSGEGRYYGADYDAGVVNSHHRGDTQEYLVCATPILADVFINMPKLKTHKKTGVTLNLKNLVGINADKNWLPHHTDGSPRSGGDQFPDMTNRRRLEQVAVKAVRKMALNVPGLGPLLGQKLRRAGKSVFGDTSDVIRSGNWYGNNTTWRMVLDLNRCLLFGNPDGTLRRNRPKRYFSVLDGLIGMEGSGPMQGEPVRSGVVMGGVDPAAVDLVATRLMGFDWRLAPVVREAFGLETLPITTCTPSDIVIESSAPEWSGSFSQFDQGSHFHFEPHFGWKGHIEARQKRV